jgi:hypothetical protein
MVAIASLINASIIPTPTIQLAEEFITVTGKGNSIALGTATLRYAVTSASTVNSPVVPTPLILVEQMLAQTAISNSSSVPSPVFAFSFNPPSETTTVALGGAAFIYYVTVTGFENISVIPTHTIYVEHFIQTTSYVNVSEVPEPILSFSLVPASIETVVALGTASFILGGDYPSVINISEVPEPSFVYDVILNVESLENISEIPGPVITTTVDEFWTPESLPQLVALGIPELILSFNPLGVVTEVNFGVPVFRQWSRASLIYTFQAGPKITVKGRNYGNGF